MNKVMLIGNLTRDVEVRQTQTGLKVATGSIATNKSFTDKNGAKQQLVQYHNIVIWREAADIFARFTQKGSKVYIEGELQHRQWDKPDGTKGSVTEVVVGQFEFLTPKTTQTTNQGEYTPQSQPQPQNQPSQQEAAMYSDPVQEEIRVEDIPF